MTLRTQHLFFRWFVFEFDTVLGKTLHVPLSQYTVRERNVQYSKHHESPPFFQVGGNWQTATLRLLESQGHSGVRRAVERGQDERVRLTAGGFRILALFLDSDRHANWRTWLPWSLPAHLLLVIKRINYGMQGHGDNNKIPRQQYAGDGWWVFIMWYTSK
jgi:hypothetical protein